MRGLHAADNNQDQNRGIANPLTLALSPKGERGQSQDEDDHSNFRLIAAFCVDQQRGLDHCAWANFVARQSLDARLSEGWAGNAGW